MNWLARKYSQKSWTLMGILVVEIAVAERHCSIRGKKNVID